jgi:hypothetical protein
MYMQVPVVKTPLSIIALFVALIELFLAYPVTQLQGTERLVLVIFMTVFPFFVASSFFIMLWHRPKNLYSPGEIAEAAAIERRVATELKVEELEQENQRLRQRAIPSQATVLPSTAATKLAEETGQTTESDVETIEAQVRNRIKAAGTINESAIEEVKRDVQRTRRESKKKKSQRVRKEMSKFRDWLEGRGFNNLPDFPEVIIEPSDFMNAYYNPSDNTAHFGALISEDSDTIAHTYFHLVIQALDVLTKFEGETAALVEGYCDYYACSYNGDPFLGEMFASAAGLKNPWLRNLEEVLRLDRAEQEPHAMSLVWSGACWELRSRYGKEKIDYAARLVLEKLKPNSTISQAACILRDEVVTLIDEQAGKEVRRVCQKRAIKIPD